MAGSTVQATQAPDARRRAMRQAMIGTGVLVLLLLALVFTDDEPAPSAPAIADQAPVQAPPPAQALAGDAGAPAQPPVAEAASSAATEAPGAPSVEAPPAPVATETPPPAAAAGADTVAEAAAPTAAPVPEPRRFPPPPPGNGYMVQLGVFTDTENAATLLLELAAAGHPAYLQSRVVLGPYPNKAAAQHAQEKIRRERKLDGMIVPPRKP